VARGSVETDALIDSGATRSLFSASIAQLIGIDDIADTELGRGEPFKSVAGESFMGYPHKIGIAIPRMHEFETIVYFSRGIPEGTAVLGMSGFFDRFIVTIDVNKEIVELIPIDRKN